MINAWKEIPYKQLQLQPIVIGSEVAPAPSMVIATTVTVVLVEGLQYEEDTSKMCVQIPSWQAEAGTTALRLQTLLVIESK